MKKLLNIAAGKGMPINPLKGEYMLINLDTMYEAGDDLNSIENHHKTEVWKRTDEAPRPNKGPSCIIQCYEDAFEFMEKISFKFDEISCYRFLEHVEKDRVLYFIYLMSTCLDTGGLVDIIVPDYDILASSLLSEIPGGTGWEFTNILLTTEMLNHPADPHASIWTEKRLTYFFNLERRFRITSIEKNYEYDGRNIYLRMMAEKIK